MGNLAPGHVSAGTASCAATGETITSLTQRIIYLLRLVVVGMIYYFGSDIFSTIVRSFAHGVYTFLETSWHWVIVKYYIIINYFVTNKYPVPKIDTTTRTLPCYVLDEFAVVGRDMFVLISKNFPTLYAWTPQFVIDWVGWCLGIVIIIVVLPFILHAATYWLMKFYERVTGRAGFTINPSIVTVSIELVIELLRNIWASLAILSPTSDLNIEVENMCTRWNIFGSCIKPRLASTWVGSKLAPQFAANCIVAPPLNDALTKIIATASTIVKTALIDRSATNQKWGITSNLIAFFGELGKDMSKRPDYNLPANNEFFALNKVRFRTDLMTDTLARLGLKSDNALPEGTFLGVYMPDVSNTNTRETYVVLSNGLYRSAVYRIPNIVFAGFEIQFDQDILVSCEFPAAEPVSVPLPALTSNENDITAIKLFPSALRSQLLLPSHENACDAASNAATSGTQREYRGTDEEHTEDKLAKSVRKLASVVTKNKSISKRDKASDKKKHRRESSSSSSDSGSGTSRTASASSDSRTSATASSRPSSASRRSSSASSKSASQTSSRPSSSNSQSSRSTASSGKRDTSSSRKSGDKLNKESTAKERKSSKNTPSSKDKKSKDKHSSKDKSSSKDKKHSKDKKSRKDPDTVEAPSHRAESKNERPSSGDRKKGSRPSSSSSSPSTKKNSEAISRSETPAKRTKSAESSTSSTTKKHKHSTKQSGKADAEFVIPVPGGEPIAITSIDPNDCWVQSSAVVLHNCAIRSPDKTLYHGSARVNFEDPEWVAANAAEWITKTVCEVHHTVKGEPFSAKSALAICMEVLSVRASTKKKDKLTSHFRVGTSALQSVVPFCKLEFFHEGESQTHGRNGRTKTFNRENHWTVFTGNPTSWFSAENPPVDQRIYNEPDATYLVWAVTNATTSKEATSKPTPSRKSSTPKPTNGSRPASPVAKVTFIGDDAPADPDEAPESPPERTPFNFPPPPGSIITQPANQDESSEPDVAEPTTIDSEEAEIFSRCTTSRSTCDSAKGAPLPSTQVLVDRELPLPAPRGNLALRCPGHNEAPTPNPDQLPSMDRGSPHPPGTPAGNSPTPLPQQESSTGTDVLASPNVLPRADSLGGRDEESGSLPGQQRGHLHPTHLLSPMARRQESMVQSGPPNATNPPICSVIRGHQGGFAKNRRHSNPRLSDAAVAPVRPQGRRCKAPTHGREHHAHWSNQRRDSPGEGSRRAEGSLPIDLSLPAGMERGTGEFPGCPAPAGSQVLVPQGTGRELGNQQRTPGSESLPLDSLCSPWSPSNNGSGSESGRNDTHVTLGSQTSGNPASLPGLGSNQRKISLQGPAGSAKPLQGTDRLVLPATSTNVSKNSYQLRNAMQLKNPPSVAQIIAGSTLSKPASTDHTTLRLHVAPKLQRIDLDKLQDLPSIDPEVDTALTKARTYLEEPNAYVPYVPARNANDCALARGITESDAQQLLDAGIIEFLEDDTLVKGSVLCFTAAEWSKLRKRLINHPKDINATVPTAPPVAFRSIPDRLQMVHSGNFIGCVDFQSYYHQLQLHKDVRNFFCFRIPTPEGPKLVRLTVAPTGGAHIVYTAVSCTYKVLSFPKKSNDCDSHIDNIAFVGDTVEDVVSDIRTLAARCKEAGFTINEDVSQPEKLVTTRTTWVGIGVDLLARAVFVPDKTIDKIKLSTSLMEGWTNRGLAGHLGLLMYAAQIIDSPVCNYFNVLRFASRLGMLMHESNHTQWDQPITLWPSVRKELAAWTEFTLTNEPYAVPKKSPPNLLMAVDSSALGWGYAALDEITGRMWTYGEPWSPAFLQRHSAKIGESVFAEPRGIILAKLHALHLVQGPRVLRVGSDNVASRATLTRRYCYRSYFLNEAARVDRILFPKVQTDYVEVPGVLNVLADDRSRHFSVSLPGELSDLFVAKDPLSYIPPSSWESPRIVVLAAQSSNNQVGNTTTDNQADSLRRLLGVFPGGQQFPGVGNAA